MTSTYSAADLAAMVDQYIETALWSTLAVDYEQDTTLADSGYRAVDLAPETRAAAEQVCASFVGLVGADLDDMDPEQAGHDLWLTRERHGAGFWDRGLGERGDRLTALARTFGGADWYVGDDGLIYGSD